MTCSGLFLHSDQSVEHLALLAPEITTRQMIARAAEQVKGRSARSHQGREAEVPLPWAFVERETVHLPSRPTPRGLVLKFSTQDTNPPVNLCDSSRFVYSNGDHTQAQSHHMHTQWHCALCKDEKAKHSLTFSSGKCDIYYHRHASRRGY